MSGRYLSSRPERKMSKDSWETDSPPHSPEMKRSRTMPGTCSRDPSRSSHRSRHTPQYVTPTPHPESSRSTSRRGIQPFGGTRAQSSPSTPQRDRVPSMMTSSSKYSQSVGGTRPMNPPRSFGGFSSGPSTSNLSRSKSRRRPTEPYSPPFLQPIEEVSGSERSHQVPRSHQAHTSPTANKPSSRYLSPPPVPNHNPNRRRLAVVDFDPPSQSYDHPTRSRASSDAPIRDVEAAARRFENKKAEDKKDWDSKKKRREREQYNVDKKATQANRDRKEKERRDRERREYVETREEKKNREAREGKDKRHDRSGQGRWATQ